MAGSRRRVPGLAAQPDLVSLLLRRLASAEVDGDITIYGWGTNSQTPAFQPL
jgi:hypothetical protein